MNRFIVPVLFLLITNSSFSQCFKTNYPVDEKSGKVIIKGKNNASAMTKAKIFDKASIWIMTNISTQPIKNKRNKDTENTMTSNKELGFVKGTLQIDYKYKEGYRYLLFDITIIASDGYYDYTINGFNMNRKPMEEYLRLKEKDEVYDMAFEDICNKLKSIILDMENSIN